MKDVNYKPVIGLEVHVELKTKSKMFCSCSADYFGAKPNTHTCPICLGLPGALPVPNKKAIDWCILIGLALNCEIPLVSKFDRKNYFYPDLPKGYQISQYDQPFCKNGYLELSKGKRIHIRRVHMEEDTGKLIHQGTASFIDFNRSGVPLVEIVTEPDFESAEEVIEYLKELQQIVRYLEVSNADMEKGEMRLEPNISLHATSNMTHEKKNVSRTTSHILPLYKVEIKNINSFRFVDRAINYEVKRQTELLENGRTPVQETRGWSEAKGETISQRSKEEAHDYRYFPEPDIPPSCFTESQISNFKSQISELPRIKQERFKKDYHLSSYDAEILTREKKDADYFERAVSLTKKVSPKTIANWIINKRVNVNTATPASLVKQILASYKTASMDEAKLMEVIHSVLKNHQKAVKDYQKGKHSVIMFLIGQVVRKLSEKPDISLVKKLLEKAIQNL